MDVNVRRSDFTFPDEDAHLVGELGSGELSPVFIMGLHRSGTTFLYQSLARVYPLAPLTAYHIVFYNRLLSRHAQGIHAEDQALLDRFFSQAGVTTRQVDNIRLSHRTVEEYCWLLKNRAGSVHLNARTVERFEEMCRKLLRLRPDCRNVVMKNPWDTALGPQISGFFPKARFVYISRDPVNILNSQLKAAETFAGHYSPYLDLLLAGFPLGRLTFFAQRMMYRTLGPSRFRAVMCRRLMRDITRELTGYRRAVRGLATDAYLETSYEQLSQQPESTLERIGEFVGLAPVANPGVVQSRPRTGQLLPEVQAVRQRFLQQLHDQSLIRANHDAAGVSK